jgi:uncharacterized protein involved in exopolysaccharide biosynthesis|tara:strand:- start:6062 stop:6976 length:915 start_codon:yes stop_codon:yes gene_type:complete
MENTNTIAQFFYNNRKLLVLALLVGGVLGIGVTYFIPKKYLSTAIVYPYNSRTRSEIIINPQFGYDVEADQLMQMLESKTMRDRTVEAFNLYDYYKLDKKDPQANFNLLQKYINDVTFTRSKYAAIVINAITEEPELSAKIANFQVTEVDKYRQSIFEENRQQEYAQIEKDYLENEQKLADLRDSIYSIKTNKNELLYNFIESLNNENYNSAEFVDDPKLELIVDRYLFLFRRNIGLQSNYLQMKQAMSQPLPSVYLIDKATPSYRKHSPSTLINGVLGAILFFALALTFRMLANKWLELKKNA